MSEHEPKTEVKEKRNFIHSAMVETLDLIERGRETIQRWMHAKEAKRREKQEKWERENSYISIIHDVNDSRVHPESKKKAVEEHNEKYGTSHTVESLSANRQS